MTIDAGDDFAIETTAPDLASGDPAPELASGDDHEVETSSEEEDDLDDWEHEGKAYRVPKVLKAGFMMNSDYTKKTMEVADLKRTIEADKASYSEEKERDKAHFEGLVNLRLIDNELHRFKQVNWQALEQEDPFRAQSLYRRFNELKEARNQTVGKLAEAENRRLADAQQKAAKRMEDAEKVLTREIKGWSADYGAKLAEHARQNGITQREIDRVVRKGDVATIKAWDDARKWREHLAKAKASAVPAPIDVKPPTVPLKGRSAPPPTGLSDRLGTEEWMKRRTKQLKS